MYVVSANTTIIVTPRRIGFPPKHYSSLSLICQWPEGGDLRYGELTILASVIWNDRMPLAVAEVSRPHFLSIKALNTRSAIEVK